MNKRNDLVALAVVLIGASVALAAPLGTGPESQRVYTTWNAAAGSLVIELDPAALGQIGINELRNSDGTPSNGSFIFDVSGAESEFRTSLQNGQLQRAGGYLISHGGFQMGLPTSEGATTATVGNFVVSIDATGGRITDQFGLFRDVFAMDAQSLSIDVDEATEAITVTAPLVIAESFADEVLGNPSLIGTVVGAVSLDLGARLVDIDTPVDGSAATGATPRGGTGNGPDVIVSDIGSTLSLNGTVSGVSAYSMTTVSCNLGEADAIWIDCLGGPQCNQHPVIGQNMYRLKAGRFEQIGMSWLKHGFCAADAPSCGSPYESNGSCDWLGTHATDTYGAGLNGSQPSLGPRSEVNAWTGVYPYPYGLAWNASGDAVYKRTQVKVTDVNPAINGGSLYFGEGHYVCTDEQPVNRYNNVSWRRVTVGSSSGGGWNMNFSGSTVTQQPAIYAWPLNDSGVTLATIDVPSDGRLILGYKATSLGSGWWHYEYALYNMNCDRSVGSFNMTVDSTVTMANIGFHDVDYHSGEPYTLTDWPWAWSANILTWQTDKYNFNPNANALRWGTLYNFRFDANSPPRPRTIQLGLFKPGTPATVDVEAIGPMPKPIAIRVDRK